MKWPDRALLSAAFLRAFHRVYGKRFFSWRRVIAGSISSLIACSMAYLAICLGIKHLLGWQKFGMFVEYGREGSILFRALEGLSRILFAPGWYESPSFSELLMIAWSSLGFNIVPDLVSIAETAWIISLASRPRANLLSLVVLDLILTTVIWFIWIFAADWLLLGFSFDTFVTHLSPSRSGIAAEWVFALTTYATSALWIGFVIVTLIVGTLRRTSICVVRLLESRLVQELSILFLTSVICLASWLVFLVAWVLRSSA